MSTLTQSGERIGDWMQLASGRQFWPLDPRPEEIDIGDIAHALSLLVRFGGHVSRFYSVAEHSVRVSRECAPEDALWGLLHDASEAYLGDLIRPLKRQPAMGAYVTAEERVMRMICDRFRLAPAQPLSVTRADEILLATEARDLMGNAAMERWCSLAGVEPLPVPVMAWGWEPRYAREAFLKRFGELTR